MSDPQNDDAEVAVTDDGQKRAVVPTEKSFEEKLHQFITARRSKLRLLTTKSNQIERLMEDKDNLIHIEQKEIKSYKRLYEEFTELNQSVKLYLKEEECEADQTFWFEPKVSNCQDFMKRVETWIEETKLHKDLNSLSARDQCQRGVFPRQSPIHTAASYLSLTTSSTVSISLMSLMVVRSKHFSLQTLCASYQGFDVWNKTNCSWRPYEG